MQFFSFKTKKYITFNKTKKVEESNIIGALNNAKTLYEQIEETKEGISIRLKKLELLLKDKEVVNNYKDKVQELIEKINRQIKDEQANEYRITPKLFLYNSFYYKNLLDKIIENIDNDLLRYNFLNKLKIYTIDKVNLNNTINDIIALKKEYEKIKFLFSENDNIDILNVFINKYFDIILLEVENNDNSVLFQKLTTREKKKIQLLLFNKIEEFIKIGKLTSHDIVELSNVEFTINDFKVYIRLLKEKVNSKTKLEDITKKELPYTNLSFSLLIAYNIDNHIMLRYGEKSATTDFAILLGGYVCNWDCVHGKRDLKNRTSLWYLRETRYIQEDVRYVNWNGHTEFSSFLSRNIGLRPVIPYTKIKKYATYIKNNKFGVDEISFGEYVNNALDREEITELEEAFSNNLVNETGKTYTTDSVYFKDTEKSFKPREHIEYEYKGQKYVRFIGDKNGEGKRLSNGEYVKIGEVYWLKVEPIIWLVDDFSDLAISKVILLAGIQYNTCKFEKFKETNIYRYLNKYFVNDIIPSKVLKQDMENQKTLIKK